MPRPHSVRSLHGTGTCGTVDSNSRNCRVLHIDCTNARQKSKRTESTLSLVGARLRVSPFQPSSSAQRFVMQIILAEILGRSENLVRPNRAFYPAGLQSRRVQYCPKSRRRLDYIDHLLRMYSSSYLAMSKSIGAFIALSCVHNAACFFA